LTQLIVIFCFSSLLLASAIILFSLYYQKRMREKEIILEMTLKNHELELLNKIVETQENEREKIAKDIHDDLGPKLTIIKLHLTSLLKSQLIKDNKLFLNITNDIDEVISELRSISQELSPTHVVNFGLKSSLTYVLSQISDSSEIQCISNLTELNDDLFDKRVTINLYRLINELLNNLLKHAHPIWISLDSSFLNGQIHFKISHNGHGLSNQEFSHLIDNSTGQGIRSIHSRVNLLKGTIRFYKNPDLSEIHLTIPLNR
jgi:two-component system, NarL family, sensor kinase